MDDPDDFVRLEIAAILERKIRAIPVLVSGAVVPKSSQLPDLPTLLVRRHAFEISDGRFHCDVDKLIQALEKVLADFKPLKSTEIPQKVKPKRIVYIFFGEKTLLTIKGLLWIALIIFILGYISLIMQYF